MTTEIQAVRKKPITITAAQWDGSAEGAGVIIDWVLGEGGTARYVDYDPLHPTHIAIDTMEGTMRAAEGWWVMRGVQGEFYPCEPGILAATYDIVEDGSEESPTHADLVDMIAELVAQGCQDGDRLDSMALSTYAEAMRFLAAEGRITIESQYGRRVIGTWVAP